MTELLKQKIEQTQRDIQTIRESLAASREEMASNPSRAREIVKENVDAIREGWRLKDELKLLQEELERHQAAGPGPS
ncbi:chromosome segregation ATPase [Bradyrhizobium barranii subsp. barranii]